MSPLALRRVANWWVAGACAGWLAVALGWLGQASTIVLLALLPLSGLLHLIAGRMERPEEIPVVLHAPWSSAAREGLFPAVMFMVVVASAAGLAGLLIASVVAATAIALYRELSATMVSRLGFHRWGADVDEWQHIRHACSDGTSLKYECLEGAQRVWRSVHLHADLERTVESWIPQEHPVARALHSRRPA